MNHIKKELTKEQQDLKIKIYQIYFKDEHLGLIEPGYIPFLNDDCTKYFESDVIKNIVDFNSDYETPDYLGIVSYQLREKVGGVMKDRWTGNISNKSDLNFYPDHYEYLLRKNQPDVMSFQRHMPHDTVTYADRFHPNFSKYFAYIMREIGYTWEPTHIKNVFYCNFFTAKFSIYSDFVNKMLVPAMKVMDTMPELNLDSRYPKKLPEDLREKFRMNHYPYHSFLCERIFSWYAHVNNLNCMHY